MPLCRERIWVTISWVRDTHTFYLRIHPYICQIPTLLHLTNVLSKATVTSVTAPQHEFRHNMKAAGDVLAGTRRWLTHDWRHHTKHSFRCTTLGLCASSHPPSLFCVITTSASISVFKLCCELTCTGIRTGQIGLSLHRHISTWNCSSKRGHWKQPKARPLKLESWVSIAQSLISLLSFNK